MGLLDYKDKPPILGGSVRGLLDVATGIPLAKERLFGWARFGDEPQAVKNLNDFNNSNLSQFNEQYGDQQAASIPREMIAGAAPSLYALSKFGANPEKTNGEVLANSVQSYITGKAMQSGIGAINNMIPKNTKTYEQLISALDKYKENPIYVRWSRGNKYDMKEGAVSRDFAAGGTHSGLSAVPFDPSSPDAAKYLAEYQFLRMKDPKIKPHFYHGNVKGTDSDGYPSIEPTKYLGTVDNKMVDNLKLGYGDFVQLKYKIANQQRELEDFEKNLIAKGVDPASDFGASMARKSLLKNQAEYGKLSSKFEGM